MKKIYTHPANLDLLKSKVNSGVFDVANNYFNSIEIVTNSNLEKDRPTGRFKLQDGRIVDRAEIKLRSIHWEYGPEDIGFLKWVGAVEEIREAVFNVVDESLFKIRFDQMFDRQFRHVGITNITS